MSTSHSHTKRTRWALIGAFLLGIARFAIAEESENLRGASQPLAEGVPAVSIVRLKTLLSRPLPLEERRAASVKLAEALVAAGEADKALQVLDDPNLREISAAKFWRAQALASLGRWNEALFFYQQMASESQPAFRADALFGKAEALRSLGRLDETLQTLALLSGDERWKVRAQLRSAELLLEKQDAGRANQILSEVQPHSLVEKKEQRLLMGRVELLLNHPEKAVELLQSILKQPTETTHSMVIAALFALAEAHVQAKAPEAATDILEDFIERSPANPGLPQVFSKLDQLYQKAPKAAARTDLVRWARDRAQPRRALAQWYLARFDLRAGRRDDAVRIFRALQNGRVKLPALAEAYLEFAKVQLEDNHPDDARAILNTARLLQPTARILERIEWLAAETDYQTQKFASASKGFEQLARSPFGAAALFNASLGWLQAGDQARFRADYEELGRTGGDEEARAELLLEAGLRQAARSEKSAGESLQKFLRDFPRHKRASEASVALAELAFHASPPRLDEARKYLAQAMELQPTRAAIERADYLKVWIEGASTNPDNSKVIKAAGEFLQKHATSGFASDIRMKLAEAYFQRQDFPNAQTQFELLAQHEPNGPYAEKALFFAGQAAMSSMGSDSLSRALGLFDQVVRKEGELKWAARNEQAALERKLGKPQDALPLYEEVLKSNARPSEKREALCGKGDTFFETGATKRENYKRAIEVYDQLASDAQTPPHWRNQALFKKGVCLEKLADRANALATFYKVVEAEARPDRPQEFFWLYKAGFNAARLLEDDAKWKPAATIYEKLAAIGGARSEEAKARLVRLRLEHFLWEE